MIFSGDIMRKRHILIFVLLSFTVAGATVYPQQTDNPFSQSKFVPDISLILDCSYLHRNHNDDRLATMIIPGLIYNSEEMTSRQGFNLNYGELTIASIVDPYFDLFSSLEFSENGFEIEEAYFTTRSLPLGFQLKGGKFMSHFGRINEQHTHYWDFSDAPLVNSAFFGEHHLNEKGIRLTWVAPFDYYLMAGGEILQGENHTSFGRNGFSEPTGIVSVSGSTWPNLFVSYIKTSFDIENLTILCGLSNTFGGTKINHDIDYEEITGEAIDGTTSITGADVTLKYLFNSIQCISLQAEYLYRSMNGDKYIRDGSGTVGKFSLDSRQAGLYTQLVGRLSKRTRTGVRLDLINVNDVTLSGTGQHYPHSLPRYSAMIEYNPTEFSRLRLQYNYDLSRYEITSDRFSRSSTHELILQMNITIGAHGAHAF
jgi:hypothetical protein